MLTHKRFKIAQGLLYIRLLLPIQAFTLTVEMLAPLVLILTFSTMVLVEAQGYDSENPGKATTLSTCSRLEWNTQTFEESWNCVKGECDCTRKTRICSSTQRWKNVQILQIYLCYFSLAVLIFCLYTRKLAKDIVLLALC